MSVFPPPSSSSILLKIGPIAVLAGVCAYSAATQVENTRKTEVKRRESATVIMNNKDNCDESGIMSGAMGNSENTPVNAASAESLAVPDSNEKAKVEIKIEKSKLIQEEEKVSDTEKTADMENEKEKLKKKKSNQKRSERRKKAKAAAAAAAAASGDSEAGIEPAIQENESVLVADGNTNKDSEEAKKVRKAEKRRRNKAAKKAREDEKKKANEGIKPVFDEPEPEPETDSVAEATSGLAKMSLNSTQSASTAASTSDSSLKLNYPMDIGVNMFDDIEFCCDCCPVELTGYKPASIHVEEFDHQNMSVTFNDKNDAIKCLSCGDNTLNKLHPLLVEDNLIRVCCTSCLEAAGYDTLIYSLAGNNELLKFVDHMYRLASLKCFKCDFTNDLAVDDDLTCYCGKCINDGVEAEGSLVKVTDNTLLFKCFDDEIYNSFTNIISLSGPNTLPQNSAANEPAKADQMKKAISEPTVKSKKQKKAEAKEAAKKQKENATPTPNLASKKDKKDKKKKKNEKKEESSTPNNDSTKTPPAAETLSKSQKKKLAKPLKEQSKQKTNQQQQPIKNKMSAPPPPTQRSISPTSEANLESKFDKLRQIIRNTLPKDVQLKFDDMKEYYNHLTYSLFLEELYSVDICADVELDWESNDTCQMSGSTKTWFDMYVNEDIHHLKKQPFSRDQPIFIIRKSDMNLDWETKPPVWAAYVSGSTLDKVDKRGRKIKTKFQKHAVAKKTNQMSSFKLKLYPWNEYKFPVKERGDKFAFVPASNVLGRIMRSMNQIENKNFIDLIMGKKEVKRINFNNKIPKFYNRLNESQKEALQSALNNTVTILQGPPGSGKTSTIYEIILQLVEQLKYFPILVVAASNLAVDNIAEKLMSTHKDKILRIISLSKEREYNLDHPLGPVCLHNKISAIMPPNLKDIEKRLRRNASSISAAEFSKYMDACTKYAAQIISQSTIIFATTTGIAGPHLKNVKEMPVIIMDESTQSSEPSTLIPLGAKGCKKVILVGDTAQLSVFTRVKTLEMSLFQRVLENGTYKNPFMLDTQYRMHPDISEFSRNKFYGGKLKDGITAEDRKMKGINYPVYFFDHKGVGAPESKQFSRTGEEFGFSWVNHKEVSYIERMVIKLIVEHNVPPSTIGIMTGYAAQRELIVKTLEDNKLINPSGMKSQISVDKEDISNKKNVTVCNVNGIIVATIDAFQGREMNFVLLSCVRSNDQKSIGFMSDKRRMNVAFTRAKYSFIICGDAGTLSSSSLWNEYIEQLRVKGYVKDSINDY